MAVPAIAEQVDDNVLLEALAIFDGGARHLDNRFRIVAIDVKDRRLHPLRDIGRVGAGARKGWARRKPDLVVDDDVDRAAGAEAAQVG